MDGGEARAHIPKNQYFCLVRPLIAILLLASCAVVETEAPPDGYAIPVNDKFFQGEVSLVRLPISQGFKVVLTDSAGETSDEAIFRYTPYHLDTADVNRDGRTDVLVGLIKPTEFDPVERKRLFILRIDDGGLRPLWLGSKVCQELINFKTQANGKVLTLEKTKKDQYAIGLYHWETFGLTLIHYLYDEMSQYEAIKRFNR